VHEGDVLSQVSPAGSPRALGVVHVWPADQEWDYRRVVCLVIDPAMKPVAWDLRSGHDSYMTVGRAAEPVDFAEMGSLFDVVMKDPQEDITPGLLTVTPGPKPSVREPEDAGFRRIGTGFAGEAHGHAILITWDELAERLKDPGVE
jgi:hypothetical protein